MGVKTGKVASILYVSLPVSHPNYDAEVDSVLAVSSAANFDRFEPQGGVKHRLQDLVLSPCFLA
jgi:hypothetical protein